MQTRWVSTTESYSVFSHPSLLCQEINFLPEGFIDIGADRLREMEEQDFVEGEEDLLDLPYENELEDD